MKVLFWDFYDTLGYRRGGWLGAMHEATRKKYPGCNLTIEDFRPFLTSGFPWHTPEVEHTELNDNAELWWDLIYQKVFIKAYTSLGFADKLRFALSPNRPYSRITGQEYYDGCKAWEIRKQFG